MTIIRLLVGLVIAALTACCTSPVTVDGAGTPTAGHGLLLPPAWTTDLIPAEPPAAASGGFVFHALSPQRRFEIVSVAAADGRVRWRAPASPSRIDHGVGLSVQTVQDGRTVLWLEPGRVYSDGEVSLVAADTVTGRRRWSYGAGRLRVNSWPSVCRHGTAVCLIAFRAGSNRPRAVVLDAGSGRILSDRATPFIGNVRRIGADLYDGGHLLARVNDRGELIWYRPTAAVFGGQRVDPNYGWNITRRHGRYLGSLGRIHPNGAPTLALADLAATAAFDAATGRTLWTRPHASVFCGQLAFDADHPVLCALTGTLNVRTGTITGLDVTLTGIDPATGTDRWRAHLGAVAGLAIDGDDADGVLRTGATTYTLRTPTGLVELDLDRGPQPTVPAADTGWCTAATEATPAQNVLGVNMGDPAAYLVDRLYPCRLDGRGTEALDRPAGPADYLNATVNGVLAYTTRDGSLRAVHTG